MNFSTIVVGGLANTPLWVWAILCYLIYIGIQATRTRNVFLPRLFTVPLLFMALKYQIFISGNFNHILIYFGAIALGFGISTIFINDCSAKIIKDQMSVELPGSYFMLKLLMVVFCIKYTLGYLRYVDQDSAGLYMLCDHVVTGVLSGYFLGRASFLTLRYFRN